MSRLAEKHVPDREALWVHIEQKMKDRVKNPPRMFGRAEVGGLEGDDRQPDGRR